MLPPAITGPQQRLPGRLGEAVKMPCRTSLSAAPDAADAAPESTPALCSARQRPKILTLSGSPSFPLKRVPVLAYFSIWIRPTYDANRDA